MDFSNWWWRYLNVMSSSISFHSVLSHLSECLFVIQTSVIINNEKCVMRFHCEWIWMVVSKGYFVNPMCNWQCCEFISWFSLVMCEKGMIIVYETEQVFTIQWKSLINLNLNILLQRFIPAKLTFSVSWIYWVVKLCITKNVA